MTPAELLRRSIDRILDALPPFADKVKARALLEAYAAAVVVVAREPAAGGE